MSWPLRSRRSSYARRDRNRALLAIIVSAMAIVAGFSLLLISRGTPAQGSALRTFLLDMTAPVWATARKPVEGLTWAAGEVGDYFFAIDRNRHLEAKLSLYHRLEEERTALARENAQLKRLLQVAEPAKGWIRVFPVSGGSPGSYVRSAVIGGGRADGVRVGQPVRSDIGLVGRVIDVGANTSRVLLLIDANSRVPVRVVRTGQASMVAGVNGPLLEVRYIAPGDALRVGDRLVTSGDGGIYPPDVPVAVVVKAGEMPIAQPVARPEALGFVIVQSPYLLPAARMKPLAPQVEVMAPAPTTEPLPQP